MKGRSPAQFKGSSSEENGADFLEFDDLEDALQTEADYSYEITEPFDPRQIDISSEVQNVRYLLDLLEDETVDLNSEFQRSRDLWSASKMSKFIESLIVRLPIPPFYLAAPERIPATSTDKLQVIDGLQRLSTLDRFIVRDESFRLTVLEVLPKEFNGKTFNQLPRPIQRAIERAQVSVYLIRPSTPKPVKFIIFNRLNTGGLALNAQEIRHALNQGVPAELLNQLVNLKSFSRLVRIRNARMRNHELALRFLAFRMVPPQNYKRGFRKFLDDAMEELSHLSANERSMLKHDFDGALILAFQLFGARAFSRKPGTRVNLNKALFETWTVNLSILSPDEQIALLNRQGTLNANYQSLLRDDSNFDKAISEDTSSPDAVKERFAGIRKLIQETLSANLLF
ncbi:MAG: DUF262 domain-containing protein [Proteobacteria bacterium]|nr:MAG: DUF262 domain-containing protein [Pseudomonadota bacterium]